MKRNYMVAVLVMAATFAVFANGEYYEIGSNPMDSSRLPNPQTEAIVKLASDSPIVSMIGGGGAVATGKRLKAGELIVVDKTTHVAKWVARCGNEITAPTGWIPQGPVMDLEGSAPAPAPEAAPAPAEQPAQQPPPPQQVDVNVNVHHDEEAPPQQTTDYHQQSVVYSQEAQPGFWDMVGQSFVQALASGLGQGLAYRMVWSGGYGGYGGYGCAPVVYYPPPAYYGGGGGDVFVNKYITKTVNVNSGNTTTIITRGGGPRGGGGPVNPPNPPGTGGGPVNPSNPGDSGSGGSGSGSGGGPANPSSLVRRGNIAGQGNGVLATDRQTGQRFQLETANGRRVPLTSQEVRANFPHGPTMGNGAWNPATRQYAPIVRGGTAVAPRIATPQQRGGYANPSRGTQQQPRVMPRQQYQPRQYNPAPQYRAPAYRPPVYRPAAPRFSAPQYRAPAYHPAPVFRGGGRFRR